MLFLILVLFIVSLTALADVSVKGYYRKNGTYVHPYHRGSLQNKDNNKGVSIKGYYRKSGTYVHPYHRASTHIKTKDSHLTKPTVNP